MLFQLKLNFYDIAMMGAGLGALFGALPLILGFIRKERSYAVFGFLGSIIGGALLGLFLSLPIVAVFTWLILRKPKNIVDSPAADSNSIPTEDSENI